MPRKKSLTRGDFVRAARLSFRREHGKFFSLSNGSLERQDGPKASCVVSKKVAPRAADRNLIKRRCRSAVREALKDVEKPCALIFYAKKGARDATFAEIKKEIESLVSKALART